jgi:putative redox protein
MDAISILRKMRQDVQQYSVEIEGLEETEEHPKFWKKIRVIFHVKGDVDPKKLHKAIDYSRSRYCGVSASMKNAVEIEYSMVLNGESTELGDPEYT